MLSYWPNLCRWFAWLAVCAGLLAGNFAQGGCQYAHEKNLATQSNPRDHARNFRFLGHWIYERGQIKYVAWQSDEPCNGPVCQADRPELPPSAIAPNSSERAPTSVYAATSTRPEQPVVLNGAVQLEAADAILLYQAVSGVRDK